MPIINLRDYYPSEYKTDHFIDVSEEVAGAMAEAEREDHAYYERRRYHKAYYSLNAGDGIESESVNYSLSPEELYINRLTRGQLYAALAALPQPQRRRIESHVIYDMTYQAIAEAEGVNESAVRASVNRGLQSMKKYIKKLL